MPSESVSSPSLVRTGARVGLDFVSSVSKGGLLGLVLGGGVFYFYLSQLQGPGNAAARAGDGVSPTLITSLLVAVLPPLFVVICVVLGAQQGRAKVLRHLVAACGEAVSQRLADTIADRIEAMPRIHGTLQRAADWLAVGRRIEQATRAGAGRGQGSAGGGGLRAESSAAERDGGRVAASRIGYGEPVVMAGDTPRDTALRGLLTRRINETPQEMSTPSRKPLYIALVAHAALLGVGLWLVKEPGKKRCVALRAPASA